MRRRRGAGAGMKACEWTLETANASCEKTARGRMQETAADVLSLQELRVNESRVLECQKLAAGLGWSARYSPALRTSELGHSGGTGVAAREGVGIRDLEPLPTDVEWPPRHRFSATVVDVVLWKGVFAGSVYLQDGVGFAGVNIGILNMVAQVLRAYGGPFVLAGDFNMSPGELRESGWAHALSAKVVDAEGVPTYIAGAAATSLDFFVVSEVLMPAVVSVQVVQDSGQVKKHRPVQLRMRGMSRDSKVQRLRKPKPFPVAQPVGCDRRPPGDYEQLIAEAQAAEGQAGLDRCYDRWVGCVQTELVDRYDCYLPSGEQDSRFLGRDRPCRAVWVPLVRPGCPSRAMGTAESRMWRSLGNRLQHLAILRRSQACAGRVRADAELVSKLRSFRCPFAAPPTLWATWEYYRPFLSVAEPELIQWVASWMHQEATRQEGLEASARARSWKHWAAVTAMQDNGRLAHRFTKAPPPWQPTPVDEEGRMLDMQQWAGRAAGEWHQLWDVHSGADEEPIDWEELVQGVEVPLPTLEQLRQVGSSFGQYTAIGRDCLHPKQIVSCSDGCLEACLALWALMFRLGRVPSNLALLVIALLPKPTGGTRPIGIFPSSIRMMARWTRWSVSSVWEASHPRSYWFGEAGKSCDVCTWRQALSAEYAVEVGQSSGTGLIDMHRAYEMVSHKQLVQNARRYGFNLRLLRFTLATYCMARVIQFRQIATEFVQVAGTLVAGCSHATTLLRLCLMGALDTVAQKWPSADLAVVVDDIQFQSMGRAASVGRVLAGAVRMARRYLAEDCHMVVSEPKFVVISSDLELDAQLASRGLGKSLARTTRNLGVDFAGGRSQRCQVRKSRLKKLRARLPMFRRLRAAGARTKTLARTGINPAALYGVGVTGIGNTYLKEARVVCRSAFQLSVAGRSLLLDLELAGRGTDPAYRAHLEPVLYFCRALWDTWVPRAHLIRAFSSASRRVGQLAHPWAGVKGPASAVAATIFRVGWRVDENMPTRWTTHVGVVDVLETPPRAVAVLMQQAVERWLWAEERAKHPELSILTPTPYLEPLHRLLSRQGADWGPRQQACLRSAACAGIWPQARLFGCGLAETDTCQACSQEVGTTWHSLYGCPMSEGFRQQYDCPVLFQQAQQRKGLPLWTRALMPDPSWSFPAPILKLDVVWELEPPGGVLEGEGFGDGSGIFPTSRRMRRCGWGLVVYTRGVGVTARLRGPLPGWQQEVPAAESMALLVYLENVGIVSPKFTTDCRFVVDTFHRGPMFSSDGWFVYAGIWRRIWEKVQDIGHGTVDVQWIPAHTALGAVDEGRITFLQREMNKQADALAKKGAAMHPVCEATVLRVARTEKVVNQVAKFIGRLLSRVGTEWPKDSEACRTRRSSLCLPRFMARRAAARTDFHGGAVRAKGHRLIEDFSRVRCIDCLSSANSRASLCQRGCPLRVVGFHVHRAHKLLNTAGVVWCRVCGAYSQFKVRGLRRACKGPRVSLARERLLRGRHPATGAILDRCLLRGDGPGEYKAVLPTLGTASLSVCKCSECSAGSSVDRLWMGLWDLG